MKRTPSHIASRFIVMAVASLMSVLAWGKEAPLPDLTKASQAMDRSLTYNPGATGMRGWIYTPHWPENIAGLDAMQGLTTGSSRQILVTHVGDKSPANGVMKVDDVILGIDDQPFTADACKMLAMPATGDPRFLPQVKAIAQAVGPPTLQYDLPKIGTGVWNMGYEGIFLCEYYLLTGDKSMVHAIHEITVTLAKGQSMYVTLGHGISALTEKGKFHGSIPPYGPVNECGLTANLAINLGKRCGVKDPGVDAAVVRANGFFGYFIDKGTIPYGEHEPWHYHENNGKSAMCAALFGVQADRIKETQSFTKMCVAAYPNTETGHAGQDFGYRWRAGSTATMASDPKK